MLAGGGGLGSLSDEGLCVAIFLCCLLCTLIADRWWRRTRVAMFHPRLFRSIRMLEKSAVALRKLQLESDRQGGKRSGNKKELAAAQSSVSKYSAEVEIERSRALSCSWARRCLLPLALYSVIRFAFVLPIFALFGSRELVIFPEYFLMGRFQALMSSLYDCLFFASTSYLGLNNERLFPEKSYWGRSLGVLGWCAVSHAVVSIALKARRSV